MNKSKIIDLVLSQLKDEEKLLQEFRNTLARVLENFKDTIGAGIQEELFIERIREAKSAINRIKENPAIRVGITGLCLSAITNQILPGNIVELYNTNESAHINTKNIKLMAIFYFCLRNVMGIDTNEDEIKMNIDDALYFFHEPEKNNRVIVTLYELVIKNYTKKK